MKALLFTALCDLQESQPKRQQRLPAPAKLSNGVDAARGLVPESHRSGYGRSLREHRSPDRRGCHRRAPGREPERGGGTDPTAGEVGKADRPAESENEEGKATGTADGVKTGDYEIGGTQS